MSAPILTWDCPVCNGGAEVVGDDRSGRNEVDRIRKQHEARHAEEVTR